MQSPGINVSKRQAEIKPTALVVDDHPEMLRRVSALLGSRFDVVAVARDGYEAIDLVRSLAPDLIVLDIVMPRLDGFQVAARLQEFRSPARVVVMTSHDDEDYVEQAFRAGARGFVHKTRLAVDLVRALDHVHEGRYFLPTLQSLLTVADSGAHAVQFHSYDRRFILGVSGLVNSALRRGHVAAVVATAAVRAGVAEQLQSYGWNVGAAGDYGRYHAMDAAESLAGIMRDDRPDPERLGESVAALERMRVETADPADGRLTLVGEIAVPLLLNGNAQGAMEIERLWNALTRELPWLGVCCYPMSCFADLMPPQVFHEVCAEHGAVGHAS
jgi:two-component system, NarL family, response regulator EvgA